MDDEKRAAYHEVGHAVIAHLSEKTVKFIRIVPRVNLRWEYWLQSAWFQKVFMFMSSWPWFQKIFSWTASGGGIRLNGVDRKMSVDNKEDLLIYLSYSMAGIAAQKVLVALGEDEGPVRGGSDLVDCKKILADWNMDKAMEKSIIDASLSDAIKTLEKHWKAVQALADVLFDKKRIVGKEVHSIIEKVIK